MLMFQMEEQEILRPKEQPNFSPFCWRPLHTGQAVNSSEGKKEKI